MSLFQRIRTPFAENADDEFELPPRSRMVGEVLRSSREEMGLHLDQVGDDLRIKPTFLAAIEQGRAQDLPGPAYAIGFVRAYARYLGLDGEQVLDHYRAESADIHARPDLALPVPLGERSVPGAPILLVALILALCGYGTWYYLSTGERHRPERVNAVPAELQAPRLDAISPSAAGTPPAGAMPAEAAAPAAGAAATPSLELGSTAPTAPDTPAAPGKAPLSASAPPMPGKASIGAQAATPSAAAPVPPPSATAGDGAEPTRIEIRAVNDCWIQIRAADQSVVFSRVLKAGQTYKVPARAGLLLRTGNAGALAIAVDGKPAPAIGGAGLMRRNVALDPDELLRGTAVHG